MSRNGKNPNVEQWTSKWSSQGSSSRRINNDQTERRIRNMSISPNRYSTSSSSSSSPPSSCVSSESEDGKSSPENTPMVLAGCPICLMYVMLSERDPRCPRCKNSVLLDFNKSTKNAPSTSRKSRKN